MTTGSSSLWSGASSRGVSGANTTRRSTSWSVVGERRRRARRRLAVGRDRRPTGGSGHSTTSTRRSHHYVSSIPYGQIVSTATHLSTDIDYRAVSDDEMAAALSRRDQAGPAERDCYASYVNEAFLTTLETHADQIVFQFSFGAEPLPFETASRLSQRTIGQVAEMIGRHPKLRFQCFLACRHANQAMCTLVRELPNLSLAGYWWHNFFPDTISQVIRERLEMVPANKQVGFFSDAYCVEWSFAKAVLVRKIMARVLAERVELGQFDDTTALEFARAIFFDSPQSLLGIVPRRE